MTDVKVGSGATFASGAASDMLALQLGYGTTNNNGNVLTQVTSFPGQSYAQTYNYDQVSRLCSVRESLGSALPSHGCGDTQGLAAGESWRQAFGYDRYGNKWVAQHLGDHMPYSGLCPTQQTNFDANTNRLDGGGKPSGV
ncbi:MAG: hypothetical protein KIT83_04210 [Bryobacterales bacterium]|nr:hypothetical protein [Bryobacterales bacterium]